MRIPRGYEELQMIADLRKDLNQILTLHKNQLTGKNQFLTQKHKASFSYRHSQIHAIFVKDLYDIYLEICIENKVFLMQP